MVYRTSIQNIQYQDLTHEKDIIKFTKTDIPNMVTLVNNTFDILKTLHLYKKVSVKPMDKYLQDIGYTWTIYQHSQRKCQFGSKPTKQFCERHTKTPVNYKSS